MLGRRPTGAVLTRNEIAKARASKFGEAEIFAYIQCRSGEYDDIEKCIISDPYADGWKMRVDNLPIESTVSPKSCIKISVRIAQEKLRRLGWLDADKNLQRKQENESWTQ